MNSTRSILRSIVGMCLWVALAASVSRADIIILNHSFEDPVVSPGTFDSNIAPGWNGSGNAWIHNPTTSTTDGGTAPDGANVLSTSGTGRYWQTLNPAFASGTSYTMLVETGLRMNQTNNDAVYDYRVYAGDTLIRRDIGLTNPTPFITPGTFQTITVTAGPIHSKVGISGNVGIGLGSAVGTHQIFHDNVRLNGASAPAPRVFNASFEAIQKVEATPSPDFSPVGWTTSGNVWLVNPTTVQTVGGAVSDGHMAVVTWSHGASLTQVIDETFRLGYDYSLYVDVASRLDLNNGSSGTSFLRLRGVDSDHIYGEASIDAAIVNASAGNFFTFGFDLGPYASVPEGGIADESLQIELVAGGGHWLWDDVQFSVIPEPSTMVLLLAGFLLMCTRRRSIRC